MNNFEFCGKHYLQVGGTAMGTKAAPNYAINFMNAFEEKHVYTNTIHSCIVDISMIFS